MNIKAVSKNGILGVLFFLTFNGLNAQTGKINITSQIQPYGSWSLKEVSNPTVVWETGDWNQRLIEVPIGTYTLVFEEITGYIVEPQSQPPGDWNYYNQSCSVTVTENNTVSFTVQYTQCQYSANQSAGCGDDPPPCNGASNLSVSNISTNSARLNWNTEAGATTTVRNREYGYTYWNEYTTTDNYFDITGLKENTEYQWQLSIECSSGSVSLPVNGNSYTTTELSCDVPTILQVDNLQSNDAELNWNTISESSYYVVGWRVSDGNWSNENVLLSHHFLHNLTADTDYEFKVKCFCENGAESSYSNTFSFHTPA